MLGPLELEEVDLALEVACFFLFGGRDSCVEDGEAVTVVRFFEGGHAEEGAEVAIVVAMPGSGANADADRADFFIPGPGGQGGSRDAILANGNLGRDVARGSGSQSGQEFFFKG